MVKTDLINKISKIKDSDIKDVNEDNSNIFWGRKSKEIFYNSKDPSEWVFFENFKMNLYNQKNSVKGSDNKNYDLIDIISLFIRCIKVYTLKKIKEIAVNIENDQTKWAVTIPTIWDNKAKEIMEKVFEKAFDEEVPKILEPEGAAMSILSHSKEFISMKKGETMLVVDCGGGTTDIVAFTIKDDNIFEEIVDSGGSADAGTQIDELFWDLITKKLVENTEFEKSIPKINKENLLENFWKKFPLQKLLMNDIWTKDIKHLSSLRMKNDIVFRFEEVYIEWLCNNNYSNIYEKRKSGFGTLAVRINYSEIRETVYLPVINKIWSTVEQKILECQNKNIKINYFFGAGGLTSLYELKTLLEENIKKISPDSIIRFDNDSGNINIPSGGAIMAGAMYMLVNERYLRRVSKKTYLIEFAHNLTNEFSLVDKIRYDYSRLGVTVSVQEIEEKMKIQEKYIHKYMIDEEEHVNYLSPICLKNLPSQKFETQASPLSEKQSAMNFSIYSSYHNDVYYAGNNIYKNDKVFFEGNGEFSYPQGTVEVVNLEIDFNAIENSRFFLIAKKDDQVVVKIPITYLEKIGR
ncbi:MAG: hypothetical protein HXX16_10215 [Bacteroidales bacterium]|nr:hypothetical protein [Bacteroidales bacterium]